MEEGQILSHQQSAGVLKMWLCSLLAMLPFLTSGFYFAYSSMGLPQMLEPNGSGILLDIHQLSWISEYHIYLRLYLNHSCAFCQMVLVILLTLLASSSQATYQKSLEERGC